MLASIWRKGNSSIRLEGREVGAATLENSLGVSYTAKHEDRRKLHTLSFVLVRSLLKTYPTKVLYLGENV